MNYTNPSIPETLLIALVGFTVVFLVLVILMGLIWLMGKTVAGTTAKNVPTPVPAAPTPAPVAAPTGLVLENVSEKEAALLMAIVADKLEKDPAELNFISIKEVK